MRIGIGLVLASLAVLAVAALARPRVVAPPAPAAAPIPASAKAAVAVEIVKALEAAPATPREGKAYFDAIRALGPDAIPGLLQVLREGSPAGRLQALNALEALRHDLRGAWESGHDLAMAAAARGLRGSDAPKELRRGALTVLYSISAESPEARAGLIEALRDADPELRDLAFQFAAQRSTPAESAALAALAADPSNELSFRLKSGIAWTRASGAGMPPELLPTAWALASQPAGPAPERSLAVELLARGGGSEASPLLLGLAASDPADPVRAAALAGLATTGRLELVKDLVPRIAAEPRPSAAKALARRLLGLFPR